MRIVHVSDIHIRNLKYHSDYRKVFDNFYEKLDELRPDLVINTGDTAHTKTQISPEFVDMCSEHIRAVASYAPYHILLGNHDLNLVNPNRKDAISPIVDSIQGNTAYPIVLHSGSGLYELGHKYQDAGLWIFSCADQDNFPKPNDWSDRKDINIGLYHGSLLRSETDIGWRMSEADTDLSIFNGLDFVLLGDIHKHQFMDSAGRIAYAGSLIQQNFGEEPDKGFLVWDIAGKNSFNVRHVQLGGSRKFYTIRLNEDLSLPKEDIESNSRIRIISPKQYTLVEQQAFEKEVRKKFDPFDIISLAAKNIGRQEYKTVTGKSIKMENLRDQKIQERLLRKYLEDRKLTNEVMDKILELNRRHQAHLEKNEDVLRDSHWKLDTIAWNNMFNYGDGNFIDLKKLKGVTGIFAPNSSGKSSLIDIITETLFDRTTKSVSKNIFLINDNKENAHMVAQVSVGDETYVIERTIERIKYGKRKLDEEKEWGKTSLNLFKINKDETTRSLNGTLRSETERNIRRMLGSHEDFLLTSFLEQGREHDIVKCKETDRRKILSRFMDLDMFEQKGRMAKDESKEHLTRLKDFEDGNLEDVLAMETVESQVVDEKILDCEVHIDLCDAEIEALRDEIACLRESKDKITWNIDVHEVKDKLLAAESEKSTLEQELNERIDKRTSVLEYIGELELEIEGTNIEEIRESLSGLEELRASYDDIRDELAKEQQRLDRWEEDVAILKKVPCGDKFPKCQFLITAVDKKTKIKEQKKLIVSLTKKMTALNIEVKNREKEDFESKYNEYMHKVSSAKKDRNLIRQFELSIENTKLKIESEKKKIEDAEADLNRYEENQEAIAKNKEIDADIAARFALLSEQEKLRSGHNDRRLQYSKKLGAKENVIKHIKSEIESLKEIRTLCDAYEHYLDAMGKYGIAYQILVEKLPMINDEINKILSAVADFNVFIEHDAEEQSIRLFLQYGDYRGRLLELGGGAERELASIAIRTALLSITNLPKTNMFIIDEGFGKLDPKNMDNVSKMFDYLRSVFDHVIIISHIDALKDMVDNNIDISSDKERYSHIEVC